MEIQQNQESLVNNTEVTKGLTQIAQMLGMQNELNSATSGPDWKLANQDWDSAIIDETAELLRSANYKWWKHEPIDVSNIKTELVDIWHFMLSKFLNDHRFDLRTIMTNYVPMIFSQMNLFTINEKPEDQVNPKEVIHFVKVLLKRTLINEEAPLLVQSFAVCMQSVGMTFEELVRRYLIKSALNSLRQEHGYKQGTYIKMWTPEKEDNYIALDLILNAEEVTSYENVYTILETHYLDNVLRPNH